MKRPGHVIVNVVERAVGRLDSPGHKEPGHVCPGRNRFERP